jgi:hypothetical protein
MKRYHFFVYAIVAISSKISRGPLRPSCLLLVCLAACSPYNFSNEVSTFSTAVDQLYGGFTSGYAALAADRAALVQLDLTGTRAKVAVATSCLDVPPSQNQSPCALYRLNGTPPALLGIEQKRDRTMALLKALKDYAQALVAVTNAADRAAYNAAVAQLASTVGAIAKDAGPQGAAASTVAPAAVNLIGWVSVRHLTSNASRASSRESSRLARLSSKRSTVWLGKLRRLIASRRRLAPDCTRWLLRSEKCS